MPDGLHVIRRATNPTRLTVYKLPTSFSNCSESYFYVQYSTR